MMPVTVATIGAGRTRRTQEDDAMSSLGTSRPLFVLAVIAAGLAVWPLALRALVQPTPRDEPDVLFVPTPQPVVDAMLEAANVDKGDVVYDLGSGDGRIVITAARRYGARGVGIDIDPALVKTAAARAAAAGVSGRVRFIAQNLFSADISEATVVTLYLLQSLNERLRPKLVRELKPGTRIVSHVFNMGPEWPAQRELLVGRSRIFVWTIAER
jgi:SAM-dependent methyltransferase